MKNQPELIGQIKRKTHNRPHHHENAGHYVSNNALIHEAIIGESDDLVQELNYQRMLHREFERKMEMKFDKMEGENRMFKQLFFESLNKNTIMQERMERVLKTIFNVYCSTGYPGISSINGQRQGNLIADWQNFQAQMGMGSNSIPAAVQSDGQQQLALVYPFNSTGMQQAVAKALISGPSQPDVGNIGLY